MNLSAIGSGKNAPEEVNVVIEISKDSHPVKYELDKGCGAFCVDRFLPTAMYYPCNYGFVPETIAGDGDPVDVLVLTRFPVITGAVIVSRPVGALMMSDESGEDVKVVAVPARKVDPYYDGVNDYSDLPQSFLDSVSHFFSFYKKLEKDKFVSVGAWRDAEFAKSLIRESMSSAAR
ncbi:inorganic pyrophosphatase [Anaplasma marginale str. Gypsy Plains]|uniref:inorganic diphosphatase n=1 Tax=Anaplasma marginale TaxID=770 RepID=UPI0003C33C28|nr:inorganic diphosphatase [Anaplasma marginale]AGZ79096.1 inorganic pyrophosphatase [Anaplasma marginale str. Gypsy Plains]AXW84302.1 inorganic diphosphatase [Anaplasma marginale]AXW85228.1 inorganic diphosphatase [Anaplasma marginale]KAA8472776.1 inorganic diphosphatase [Anaplasma marginale]KAB0451049.1 inorganic diphosphatase [Anaplasma marginale]